MAWARIDDAFDDHPKVLALLDQEQGGAAIGLWTLCLTWAHRNTLRRGKTPGLIPAHLPRRYLGPGARELAALLVKEDLWEARDEGGGWLIHDFDKYLPTPKTREARSEAGKRGAAARWAKRGSESEADGNLPSNQDNLPDDSQDAASNAMASDGSRAPAHRAISKEIAPVPEPVPTTSGAGKPRRREPPSEANVGTVVAAFVDGATGAGLQAPAASIRARVGKQARQLLAEGLPIGKLTDSARRMGAGEWNDLAVQVRKDDAAVNGKRPTPARRAADEAAAVRAQLAARRKENPA